MRQVQEKIKTLEDKVNQLIQKLEYLKKENLMLIQENVKLKTNFENRDVENESGGEKLKTNGQNNGQDKFKQELDHYIHELNKCIEWMNTM